MATYTFAQIEKLWTDNGGNPVAAPIMAAIALAESGGRTDAANTKPPDASYGLWQINYYGSLAPGRSAAYGTPAQLVADPNRQAKAAISISGNGSNFKPWTTYTSGAYKAPLAAAGSLGAIPALPAVAGGANAQAAGLLSPAGTAADNEGCLFDIPQVNLGVGKLGGGCGMQRATARKIVGGAVLVAGAVVGLAGTFLLLGGKAPSVAGVVQTGLKQRGQTARTKTREAGLSERQDRRSTMGAERDDLAQRRRARQAKAESQSASARAAGEQAADAAGGF